MRLIPSQSAGTAGAASKSFKDGLAGNLRSEQNCVCIAVQSAKAEEGSAGAAGLTSGLAVSLWPWVSLAVATSTGRAQEGNSGSLLSRAHLTGLIRDWSGPAAATHVRS